MEQYPDYVDLLRGFNTGRVRYLVVGAHAVSYYSAPRYTKDIDVWVDPTPVNARRVYRFLAAFGAHLGDIGETDFADKGTIVQIGVEPVRIDLLTDIGGVEFDKAWHRRKRKHFGSILINVIGPDDLLHAKRAANRPQDRIDVQNLTAHLRKKKSRVR